MEIIIKTNNIRNLKVDGFYIGEEFCENLIPSKKEFIKLKKKIKELKKKLFLLTPPVTDIGLKKIVDLLGLLDKDDEIIVNDLGVLNLVNKKKIRYSIGRLLSKNMIVTILSLKNKSLIKRYIKFLGNFQNIEIDKLNLNNLNINLKNILNCNLSFYKNNIVWSLTRRCAFVNHSTLNKMNSCNHECKNKKISVKNNNYKNSLYVYKNIIIEKNKNDIKINSKIFDRVIIEKN